MQVNRLRKNKEDKKKYNCQFQKTRKTTKIQKEK